MFEHQKLYIVELTVEEIKLIGQMLHLHLKTEGKHDIGEGLLKSLINQSDLINSDPEKHSVYDNFDFMTQPIQIGPVWCVPFDS